MPIKQSAIKYLRQTKKKTLKNIRVKRKLKDFIKDVRKALRSNDKEKLIEYKAKLQKMFDKAAQKKIIKPNNAARRKSRLMGQINVVTNSSTSK